MRQLFQNLIGNALKFHKPGEKPMVRVRSISNTDSGCQIVVEDNGIGFDPAGVGAGATSKDPLRIAGGNGLANMRKRIEGIGGACQVDSSPGQGTTVRFIVRVKK